MHRIIYAQKYIFCLDMVLVSISDNHTIEFVGVFPCRFFILNIRFQKKKNNMLCCNTFQNYS